MPIPRLVSFPFCFSIMWSTCLYYWNELHQRQGHYKRSRICPLLTEKCVPSKINLDQENLSPTISLRQICKVTKLTYIVTMCLHNVIWDNSTGLFSFNRHFYLLWKENYYESLDSASSKSFYWLTLMRFQNIGKAKKGQWNKAFNSFVWAKSWTKILGQICIHTCPPLPPYPISHKQPCNIHCIGWGRENCNKFL